MHTPHTQLKRLGTLVLVALCILAPVQMGWCTGCAGSSCAMACCAAPEGDAVFNAPACCDADVVVRSVQFEALAPLPDPVSPSHAGCAIALPGGSAAVVSTAMPAPVPVVFTLPDGPPLYLRSLSLLI